MPLPPAESSSSRLASADRQIRLPGGRRLGLTEFGAGDGTPVLYCHGFPGSRREAALTAGAAIRAGIRVIAPDRPGIGLSDFQPGRKLIDWPRDAAALADALGILNFSVLGVSGGAPYALACAASLGDRVTATALVGSLGPLDRAGAMRGMPALSRLILSLYSHTPSLGKIFFAPVAAASSLQPDLVFALLTARLPLPDRAALRGEPRRILAASYREALARGSRGADRDLFLYTRPWGFSLQTVATPVFLWHGERDATVPAAHGRFLARAIPRCQAFFCPEEGHFSLPILRAKEIFSTLAAAVRKETSG